MAVKKRKQRTSRKASGRAKRSGVAELVEAAVQGVASTADALRFVEGVLTRDEAVVGSKARLKSGATHRIVTGRKRGGRKLVRARFSMR